NHKKFFESLEIRLFVQVILKIESIKEALKKSSFFRRFFLKDFTNVLWRFASMTTCSHFV
ncbi:hypothetical protein, partial [Enterococcus faecium]|uniref:hypothetical protein n=1 Tax=Enterococcus faecium TaxID=1352 RepID=UPI0002825A09